MKTPAPISFNAEDVEFELNNPNNVSLWVLETIENEGFEVGFLDFIFCSDDYLLNLNITHLQHDTYTDIITFNYNEKNTISGDIFISIDRIKENANTFATSFTEELYRVIIHGVLHLIDYNDKTPEEQQKMRQKENDCLKQIKID